MLESPEKVHINREQIISPEKKVVMERAHEERLHIVARSFERLWEETVGKLPPPARSSLSMTLNSFPIIAPIKMTIEAGVGKTLSGRDLSNDDRMLQLITALTSSLCLFLGKYAYDEGSILATGGSTVAGAASWMTYGYLTQEETLDNANALSEKYKDKFPRVFQVLEYVNSLKADIKKFLDKSNQEK